MSAPSLLDIAKFPQNDARDIIEEVLTFIPEAAIFPWQTIPGQQYKTTVRTSDPTSAFRNANDGTDPVKSAWDLRLVETFILDNRWECDKAVADVHPRGAAYFIGLEAVAIMRAALKTVATQVYYGRGTGGDAKGFPGFLAAYDSTDMVVDATGSTENTCSSVWAIKRGEQDVSMILGGNGAMSVSDIRLGDITGQNSKKLTGYIQDLTAWVGLGVGNKWSIGRIKNLTAQSGKGLTDALISQLLEKFPVGHEPDLLLMSRRSRGQLQRSRTATNPTGAPAPIPTESFGIPIQVTDSILNTEATTL